MLWLWSNIFMCAVCVWSLLNKAPLTYPHKNTVQVKNVINSHLSQECPQKTVLKGRGCSQVVHKLHNSFHYVWIFFTKTSTQHGLVYYTVVCQQVWVLLFQPLNSSLLLPYHGWSTISSDGHNIFDINSPFIKHLHDSFIDVLSSSVTEWSTAQ